MLAAVDPGFWWGAQRRFDPRGALSPQFAQNRGFPEKIPENCMILDKSWWQGGLLGSASGPEKLI